MPPATFLSRFGAVFDLDGVLIDSHDQHERSWFLLADELGLPLTKEQFKISFGMRNAMVIPEVFHWASPEDARRIQELGDRKEARYRDLLRDEGLEPLPGVLSLLEGLRAAGIPCSVGSSTPRENVGTALELAGLQGYFSAYTAAEDVARGKPDPEVFLKAAAKIDRDPAWCVVFEDAHVGVAAARAAGMKVVAVTTTHPAESFSEVDWIVSSLGEVTLDRLQALFV